ncbi:hypothetical protein F5H01DRAFT_364092 [Linnemannia elongata]|nr:hypothetical protein F5H01DRAFT_364092 [Linnemannia elongata]
MRLRVVYLLSALVIAASAISPANTTTGEYVHLDKRGLAGDIFSYVGKAIEIGNILNKQYRSLIDDSFRVSFVNNYCGAVTIMIEDETGTSQGTYDLSNPIEGKNNAVVVKIPPKTMRSNPYVAVARATINGQYKELYRWYITGSSYSGNAENGETRRWQSYNVTPKGPEDLCYDTKKFNTEFSKCIKKSGRKPCDPTPSMFCGKLQNQFISVPNKCGLGLPPTKLSTLGLSNGKTYAFRNQWPTAVKAGQGYMSRCDGCTSVVNPLAAAHGSSKSNGFSQFKVEVVSDAIGTDYAVVRLRNQYNEKLCLSICQSCGPSKYPDVWSFTKDCGGSYAEWMVANVGGSAVFMTNWPGRKYDVLRVCEGCLSNKFELLTSKMDLLNGIMPAAKWTVERV